MAGQIQAFNRPNDNFTILSNEFVRCANFPPSAFHVAVFIFSHGADFALDQDGIAVALGIDRSTVSKAFTDLEGMRLLVRRRCTDERGHRVADDLFISQREFTESEREALSGKTQRGDSQRGEIPQPKEDQSLKKTKKTSAPSAPSEDEQLALVSASVVEDEPEAKTPTDNQRVNVLAGRHYERLGKMGNVAAFAKIIKQALKAGHADADVDTCLIYIAENRWTLTAERLANVLRGGPRLTGGPVPKVSGNTGSTMTIDNADAWLAERYHQGDAEAVARRTGRPYRAPATHRIPKGQTPEEFLLADRKDWIKRNRVGLRAVLMGQPFSNGTEVQS